MKGEREMKKFVSASVVALSMVAFGGFVGAEPLPTQHGAEPLPTQHGAEPLPTQHGSSPLPTQHGAEPLPTQHGAPLPTQH